MKKKLFRIAAAEFVRHAHRHGLADAERRDALPMRMGRFAEVLAARLPENAIVFDDGFELGTTGAWSTAVP